MAKMFEDTIVTSLEATLVWRKGDIHEIHRSGLTAQYTPHALKFIFKDL